MLSIFSVHHLRAYPILTYTQKVGKCGDLLDGMWLKGTSRHRFPEKSWRLRCVWRWVYGRHLLWYTENYPIGPLSHSQIFSGFDRVSLLFPWLSQSWRGNRCDLSSKKARMMQQVIHRDDCPLMALKSLQRCVISKSCRNVPILLVLSREWGNDP